MFTGGTISISAVVVVVGDVGMSGVGEEPPGVGDGVGGKLNPGAVGIVVSKVHGAEGKATVPSPNVHTLVTAYDVFCSRSTTVSDVTG